MLTFTIFFLTLGMVSGALAHNYERTLGVHHVGLALCLVGVAAFTLLLMQATVPGFEASVAVIFWVAGYAASWMTCKGIGHTSHKGH